MYKMWVRKMNKSIISLLEGIVAVLEVIKKYNCPRVPARSSRIPAGCRIKTLSVDCVLLDTNISKKVVQNYD